MNLENAISLQDVLLVPRYNSQLSRSDCKVNVDIYSNPMIASCMDTVYSPEMDELLTSRKMICVVHRYFKSAKEQLAAAFEPKSSPYRYFAVGKDQEWIKYLYDNNVHHFCVDMAHGDSKVCVDTVKYIRSLHSGNKIMAGNVATRSGFSRLENAGANKIRVGIGSGCFTPEMLVLTNKGPKPIKDINIGDIVYTHTGELHPVIDTLQFERDEELLIINDIECTKNHEFYVVHQDDADKVNDNNLEQYAKWISAEDLTGEYLLVEIDE